MRKLWAISYLFMTVLYFALLLPAPQALAAEPVISAETGLVMDMQSGKVLFGKDIDREMYPASTTKILTAIIAIEEAGPDELVTVSQRASGVEGSAIGLQVGEQIKMENLLYALMMSSANDAAVAIAEHIAGSVDEFAVMMNQKAREAGASNSNFVNPDGLPDPRHYSTARDLALISRYAMQNQDFRRLVATSNHEIERNLPEEMQPQTWLWNHNRLLHQYTGALGVKTGYTVQAGQCLVSAAARDGREMLAVVMKCDGNNHYTDSAILLDYGFENFETRLLVKKGQLIGGVDIPNGTAQVSLITASDFYYSFPVGSEVKVEQEIVPGEDFSAPVDEREQVAKLVLSAEGSELGQVDLVAARGVDRKRTFHWWHVPLALFAIITLLRIRVLLRRRRRRGKMYVDPRRFRR
ncbi:MAG: D-alanyl-D-alanine carboxypeptidase family protein [Bacillota bacterium]